MRVLTKEEAMEEDKVLGEVGGEDRRTRAQGTSRETMVSDFSALVEIALGSPT